MGVAHLTRGGRSCSWALYRSPSAHFLISFDVRYSVRGQRDVYNVTVVTVDKGISLATSLRFLMFVVTRSVEEDNATYIK